MLQIFAYNHRNFLFQDIPSVNVIFPERRLQNNFIFLLKHLE